MWARGAEVVGDVAERSAGASASRAFTGELGEEGDFAKTRRERGPDAVSACATLRRRSAGVSGHEVGTGTELAVGRGVSARILRRDCELRDAFAAVEIRQCSSSSSWARHHHHQDQHYCHHHHHAVPLRHSSLKSHCSTNLQTRKRHSHLKTHAEELTLLLL